MVELSYDLVVMLFVSVWVLIMHGGTNRNRCTQRLVIFYAPTY